MLSSLAFLLGVSSHASLPIPSTMIAYLSLPPHYHNVTFHRRSAHFPVLLSARSGRVGLVPLPFLLLLLPPLLYLTGCWAVLCGHVACQLSRQGPAYCTARLLLEPSTHVYVTPGGGSFSCCRCCCCLVSSWELCRRHWALPLSIFRYPPSVIGWLGVS